MDKDEPLDKAAARELQEETSVNPKDVLLTQASTRASASCPGRCACVSAAALPEHLLYEHDAKFLTEFKSACIVIKQYICIVLLTMELDYPSRLVPLGIPDETPGVGV